MHIVWALRVVKSAEGRVEAGRSKAGPGGGRGQRVSIGFAQHEESSGLEMDIMSTIDIFTFGY